MSYIFGTNTECLYNLRAAVTKNTYTTAAAISPVAGAGAVQPVARVPVSFWGDDAVHKSLWVHAEGTITNAATAATFIGQACLNTTANTLLAAHSFTYWPILAPTASTVCLWRLDVRYTCIVGGSLAQWQYNAEYEQSVVATGVLSTAPQNVKSQGILTSATTGTTADLFVELFGTWSGSSGSNSTVLQQLQVFGIN
jgi:hypothetical protein